MPRPGRHAGEVGEKTTRERILDAALDLFIDQGFDATSLREIAERLGFSKAALYHHFASKEDILLALHLRLHQLGREAVEQLADRAPGPDASVALLDRLIDVALANRKLFVLHERNRAVFAKLHDRGHEAEHEDLESRIREALAAPEASVEDRVRLACGVGVVIGGLFMTGSTGAEPPDDVLGKILHEVVGDVVAPLRARGPGRGAGSGSRATGAGKGRLAAR